MFALTFVTIAKMHLIPSAPKFVTDCQKTVTIVA